MSNTPQQSLEEQDAREVEIEQILLRYREDPDHNVMRPIHELRPLFTDFANAQTIATLERAQKNWIRCGGKCVCCDLANQAFDQEIKRIKEGE